MMNVKTLAALGLFIVLAVFVWVGQDGAPERGIQRLSMKQIDTEAVDRIEVKGDSPVIIEKKDGQWVLPTGRLVQTNAVQRALESLQKVESSTVLATDISTPILEKWGLDEASRVSVVLQADGREVANVALGKVTAGRVPLLTDGVLFSAKGVFPGAFSKPKQAWLEKRIFLEAKKSLKSLEYKKDGTKVYGIERSEDGSAQYGLSDDVVLPKGFRLGLAKVESVASVLMELRAKTFVETDLGEDVTGLTPGSDAIYFEYEVDGEDGIKSDVLVLGASSGDNGVYARLKNRKDTFVIPVSTADLFRQSVLGFRDLSLMAFNPSEVVRFHIIDGKLRLHWKKEGEEWILTKSSEKIKAGFELDSSLVPRRLNRLAGMQGLALAKSSLAKAGLPRSRSLVKLSLADGTDITLKFGRATSHKEKDAVYVIGNADDSVYKVATSVKRSALGMLGSFEKRPAPPAHQGMGNIDPAVLSKLPPQVRQQLLQQMRAQQKAKRED